MLDYWKSGMMGFKLGKNMSKVGTWAENPIFHHSNIPIFQDST
jgi:hypothetical protein